jgi:hypothetical protein
VRKVLEVAMKCASETELIQGPQRANLEAEAAQLGRPDGLCPGPATRSGASWRGLAAFP